MPEARLTSFLPFSAALHVPLNVQRRSTSFLSPLFKTPTTTFSFFLPPQTMESPPRRSSINFSRPLRGQLQPPRPPPPQQFAFPIASSSRSRRNRQEVLDPSYAVRSRPHVVGELSSSSLPSLLSSELTRVNLSSLSLSLRRPSSSLAKHHLLVKLNLPRSSKTPS